MFIIIIGCGRFGSNLAKELSDDGNDICIIDRDGGKLNTLGNGFNGRKIKGIEFDSDNLIEAGVEEADALIAVTSDDNINIMVALIAERIYKIPQIIARVNDPDKKFIYQKLNINTINPVQYEIEILKSKLSIKNLEILTSLDNNYEILEISVDKPVDIAVSEIENRFHCNISAIKKNDVLSMAQENSLINNNDKLICFVNKSDREKLLHYLCKEASV